MLYGTLKRLIERGQTDGLWNKLDVFFAYGSIDQEQYSELLALMGETEGKES